MISNDLMQKRATFLDSDKIAQTSNCISAFPTETRTHSPSPNLENGMFALFSYVTQCSCVLLLWADMNIIESTVAVFTGINIPSPDFFLTRLSKFPSSFPYLPPPCLRLTFDLLCDSLHVLCGSWPMIVWVSYVAAARARRIMTEQVKIVTVEYGSTVVMCNVTTLSPS